MDSAELTTLGIALIRISVFFLYALVGAVSFWRLFPRLSPISQRIAGSMLVAQIIVVVLGFQNQASSSFDLWLWDVHEEGNVPATFASTQLALVAGVALVAAWLAKARPTWQRLYLFAIGLVFIFIARDEYVSLHEHTANWERYYIALGVLVAAATALVAARSARSMRVWHLCLLTGLAISATGAIAFEAHPLFCGRWDFLPLDGCNWAQHYEESLEFLGIWLVLVGVLGQFSAAAPSPKRHIRIALYALPPLWVLLLVHNALIPRFELPLLAKPADVQIESGVGLQGYRIDRQQGSIVLRLYVSSRVRDYLGLGYSIHLVDQVAGDTVARRDIFADSQYGFLFSPGYDHVYRQAIELEFPPQAPTNRALWLVLTTWRHQDGEKVHQTILASDHELLDETHVVLGELVLPAESADTSTAALAVFDKGFALETVDMPERAQAGETLRIPFSWRSDEDARADHLQFLQFGNVESGDWWVYDQQPLGTRLPTRLWYSGLADTELWEVPIPADLSPGRYEVFTGLYRTRDLERVPARDADGVAWLDGRVLLGSLISESR